MEKRTFTVTLADGTTLSELDLNGNNFISYKEVKPETFAGKLSNVKITGSEEADEAGLIGEHNNMELIQIQQHGSEYWFILRDIPADKLAMTKLQSDVAYLSMMSGIDLD